MTEERLPSKFTFILHADVAGSTELVRLDEHVAHRRIQDTFRRFGEIIKKYHGHVRELRGDALLAEFERASDAVTAALAFQADQFDYNTQLNDSIQPTVRVGIAMGEVVIADNTITGDGVVLAQRLEQLAESGEVYILDAAYQTVPKRLPFEYEDQGERKLKGFEDPVRVYAITVKSGVSIPLPETRSAARVTKIGWRTMVGVGVAALIVVGGWLAWFQPWVQREEPASVERMAFPLPDKPSIAVLPFTNISGDPEQEYFADGMTEDLITDLSKLSGMFVIARNSVFTYKGNPVKVGQVAEELGVRYVLEGSVRRVGDEVRINAQLIDATTGGHLWAERYDGSLVDIFALQDRVTTKIVDAMSVTLTPQELENLGSFGTSNVAAHDAFLQGLSFYLRNTPADNARAETHFKRAVELDPDFKRAYTALAKVYYKGQEEEFSDALVIYWREAIFLAHKNLAKSVGAKFTDAHVIRSQMALQKHQVRVALREAEQALDISTNDVEALKAQARSLIYSGQYAEGRKLANRVIRLDPVVLAEPLYIIGLSHIGSGSYDKAADYIERALENDATRSHYNRILAAVYGKLGMAKEARQAWLKFKESWTGPLSIAGAVRFYPFEDGEILEHLAEGFKVAQPGPSRFLKLDHETRLTGQEIKTLLFGNEIKGRDYWRGMGWGQKRTIGGKVSHTGEPIHLGISTDDHNVNEGESWIEGDRLCNRWPDVDGDITNCVLIFRDSDGDENDFYMVTDIGPSPFRVSN